MRDALWRNRWGAGVLVGLEIILFLMLKSPLLPEISVLFNSPVFMISFLLPWTVELFGVDPHVLQVLPLSRSGRGYYQWIRCEVMPLLALLPLVASSLLLSGFPPLARQLTLTAAVSFPLSAVLFLRQKEPGNSILDGPLFIFLLPALSMYVSGLLYWRYGFPWFFLILTPFALIALATTYRRAHLLGVYRFPTQSRRHLSCKEQPLPEPWNTVSANLLGVSLAVIGAIGAFAFIHSFLGTQEELSASDLNIVAAIPIGISFGQTYIFLFKQLRLLRALPLDRSLLSAAALSVGLVGLLLPVAALSLLRHVFGLQMLMIPLLNYVLLVTCGGLFMPALGVLYGHTKWRNADLLPFLAVVCGTQLLAESKAGEVFSGPSPLPPVVAATAMCFAAAFFLLRHALLKANLDWRYAREVQQLTTGRNLA